MRIPICRRGERAASMHRVKPGIVQMASYQTTPNVSCLVTGFYPRHINLEISAADKHKYTCSATHLSLDNKLDIDLGNEVITKKTIKHLTIRTVSLSVSG